MSRPAPLFSPPPPRLSSRVSLLEQDGLRDRSPASEGLRVPARRSGPPLINAQAGARAVWQHKTNNATTQPSLLLTELQPTALFRPLRLHSAPCTRPSGPPHPLPHRTPHLHLPVLLHHQTFVVFRSRSRRIFSTLAQVVPV